MDKALISVVQVNKFHWQKGGSELVYLSLIGLLEDRGHRVVPFSMKHENNLPTEYSKYFVEKVEYEGGGAAEKASAALKALYSLDARRKMRALLMEHRPDVAHFHNFQHQISPSAFGPLKEKGVPIVATLHDLKVMCPNYKMLSGGRICERCRGGRFYNCALQRCMHGSYAKSLVAASEMYFHRAAGFYDNVDLFISPSMFIKEKMAEYGFPSEKIEHIPNFIRAEFYPVSERDEAYILYFGRLAEEKGVSTLLRAMASCPDIPCVIAGSGPMEDELKRQAASLGIDNVTFAGHRRGDELIRLVAGCSFSVIPSECYENCPMSVLESLVSGKPVTGSRIGGIPELIDEGVDGLTFEPGDAADLAEKIRALWEDRAGRKAMGRAGAEKVRRLYNPERHYEMLMGAYGKALAKAAP